MADPMAQAQGEIIYCRDKHCTMSKWKDTLSLVNRLVVGTSSIITSSKQRPEYPSVALAQRSKCSTRDWTTFCTAMGLSYLSKWTQSASCALAYV